MRISTSKSEAMVLSQKRVEYPLQVRKDNSEGGSKRERADERVNDGRERETNHEEKEEDVSEYEEDGSNANTGWAEAMGKILWKKTTDTKSSILMMDKELDKIKAKERQEQLERKKQVDKKQAWEMMFREKPDIVKDRETERALQRIATRGVVQLFNAVRKHQKTMDDKVKEVGGSERKKAKIFCSVSKKDFIDVLRREEEACAAGYYSKCATVEKPAWSVLSDDFMMGATMKDWDKNSDHEEPHGGDSGGNYSDPTSALHT
uniref:RRP15-like protein n=1 Tax=Amphilophus citrinellus TaxID=61819 RepID=A0A3Q0RSA0_AMPCI